MSRKLGPKDNFRVVIDPVRAMRPFGLTTQATWESRMQDACEDIVADIRRHVDDVGYVQIVCDQEQVCEHCGYRWSEESKDYNGGCCEKDEAAEEARAALQSST